MTSVGTEASLTFNLPLEDDAFTFLDELVKNAIVDFSKLDWKATGKEEQDCILTFMRDTFGDALLETLQRERDRRLEIEKYRQLNMFTSSVSNLKDSLVDKCLGFLEVQQWNCEVEGSMALTEDTPYEVRRAPHPLFTVS